MYPNGDMPFAGKAMRWIWEAPGLDADIKQMNEKIMNTLKIDFEKDFSGRNPIYLRQVGAVFDRSNILDIRDDITARWEHDFKIESPNFTAEDLNSVMPLIQKCAADLLASIGVDCDRVKDQTMPTISGRLLDYITKTSSKYTILGAHDTTGKYLSVFLSPFKVWLLVGPMLSALQADKSVRSYWPRFCAHIDFEFLSNDAGQEFVRVLYDEVPITIGGKSWSPIIFIIYSKVPKRTSVSKLIKMILNCDGFTFLALDYWIRCSLIFF